MAKNGTIYSFGGARQDMSKEKHHPQYYFEAQHIKILATDGQSTAAAKNEKGNTNVITIPTVTITEATSTITYGTKTLSYDSSNEIADHIAAGMPTSSSTQIIIGHIETREGLVLWTTDDLGFDCVWHVPNILDGTYDLTLLYVRDFDFSSSYPIQAVYNFENENIQKVYWVDGLNQMRYMNLTHDTIEGNTPLIDVPMNTVNFVGNVEFGQPKITSVISGGNHTAGMIQYGYNLFRLNGSQTKISPLSDLVALDKGENLGGGLLNEEVSVTPVIQIDDIDQSYSIIKLYAVKYTSRNQEPEVYLVDEREISGPSMTIYDDGNFIEPLTLDEFLFLGSNPIIPSHIETKYNRLFMANIKDGSYDLPDELDCRAYSFPISSTTTKIYDDPQLNPDGTPNLSQNFLNVTNTYTVPLEHDAINLRYSVNNYQYNSTTRGGTGKYVSYELVQRTEAQLAQDPSEYRFLKDGEIYRIGIEFYNNLGQTTPPRWIADFRVPEGNLQGNYNTLKVTLTAEFYTWLSSFTGLAPIGYRILRAERTVADRTIVAQGALCQYMVQTDNDADNYSYWQNASARATESAERVKIPVTLSRGFISNINPLNKTNHLEMMNELSDYYGDFNSEFPDEEIYSGRATAWKRQQSWQYTKLWQMYVPEVLFNVNLTFSGGLYFRVKGLAKNTDNHIWLKRVRTTNEETVNQWSGQVGSSGDGFFLNTHIQFLALFGPSDASDQMDFQLIHREYLTYLDNPNKLEYPVYGIPEVTEKAQEVTNYNGNPDMKYQNTMAGFMTDRSDDIPDENAIVTMNSTGIRCVTFAEGTASDTIANRKGLEDLYNESGLTDPDGLLIAEIVMTDGQIVASNIYGGSSYEDKTRTTYVKIGDYTKIGNNSVQIDNAGDVYVHNFKIARIVKTDSEVLDDQTLQLTEIINFPAESEVDLKNRSDKSLFQWDAEFQPSYDSYFKYNTVYSQQPTLVNSTSLDFTFRLVKGYDTRIQATKVKTPNESVDSWTDVLENEFIDLNGKYGPINGLVTYKDTVYAFQDKAISIVNINPRIQVQGNDGVGIELGIGDVLYDYKYITNRSGSINKWSIVPGKKGIYYYDALNRAVGRVPDGTEILLTDLKGMHSFFNTNYDYDLLKVDNPVLSSGAVFGVDNYNSDVYMTLLQGDKSFTWLFSEIVDEFVDLKTYKPSRYVNNGEKLLIPASTNNTLWEQYAGEYNNFFGVTEDSYITFMMNPAPTEFNSTTFDTLEFNSEAYLNGIDLPAATYTHIRAHNEYQDTGYVPLTFARDNNLRRKFRKWRAAIPREGRNRIKNTWTYLDLKLENDLNYEVILHDIILHYTV